VGDCTCATWHRTVSWTAALTHLTILLQAGVRNAASAVTRLGGAARNTNAVATHQDVEPDRTLGHLERVSTFHHDVCTDQHPNACVVRTRSDILEIGNRQAREERRSWSSEQKKRSLPGVEVTLDRRELFPWDEIGRERER
jgi:hypothetical protein